MAAKVSRKLFAVLVQTVMAFTSDVTLVIKDGRCGFSNFDTNHYSHLSIDIVCTHDTDEVVSFDPKPLMQFLKIVTDDDININVTDKVVVSCAKQRVSIVKYLPRENTPGVKLPVTCVANVSASDFIDTIKIATAMETDITLKATPGQIIAKVGTDADNTFESDYTIKHYEQRPEKLISAIYMPDLFNNMLSCLKEFDTLTLKFSNDNPIIVEGQTTDLTFKLLVANKLGAE